MFQFIFRRSSQTALSVFLLACFSSPGISHGQIDWNNTSNSNSWFDHDFNWSGGSTPGATDYIRFNQNSAYEVWWGASSTLLLPEVQRMWVTAGDVTLSNQSGISQTLQINGQPAFDSVSDFMVSGPASVIVDGIHIQCLGGSRVFDGALTIDGSDSQLSVTGIRGLQVEGQLDIVNGGSVTSSQASIGNHGGWGNVSVTNANSHWNNTGHLWIGQGEPGELTVSDHASVVSGETTVGSSRRGDLSIANANFDTGLLIIGKNDDGDVEVLSGGNLNASEAILGHESLSSGNLVVNGLGAEFTTTGALTVGLNGTGALDISSLGSVVVGAGTSIGENGSVSLNNGLFDFGSISMEHFNRIDAVSGTLRGRLDHFDNTDVATLNELRNSAVDVSQVALSNFGTLYGNGTLGTSLTNQYDGEVETLAGERMRFASAGNENFGEINNFGGQIRFDHELTNDLSGFIGGRGQFVANGGWINSGVMAFSGGNADVLGDVEILGTGQVVTAGGGTTTFFDDVLHNGIEIHTAAGSNTVFFGELSGAGPFTGTGVVFAEGDLRPGNSPAKVLFEGDLILGSGADTFIEIAGLGNGDFDAFEIHGDLSLDGSLGVDMIDGFQLGAHHEFLIAEIGGLRTGMFDGLAEGDLVGTFNGRELFISYQAGDGNDVALFSSVPEPGAFALLALGSLWFVGRRRRAA